jgi:alkylation response protein AidB-like acyl-CoA dehydrogenase
MIADCEAVSHWLENITYQMTQLSYKQQAQMLAGPIALLKYQSTRVALKVADNAVQIFGGRGITRTGMGHKVGVASLSAEQWSFFLFARASISVTEIV